MCSERRPRSRLLRLIAVHEGSSMDPSSEGPLSLRRGNPGNTSRTSPLPRRSLSPVSRISNRGSQLHQEVAENAEPWQDGKGVGKRGLCESEWTLSTSPKPRRSKGPPHSDHHASWHGSPFHTLGGLECRYRGLVSPKSPHALLGVERASCVCPGRHQGVVQPEERPRDLLPMNG